MPTIGGRARKTTPESRWPNKARTLGPLAPEALQALMMDLEKTAPTIRLAAAREILDRRHGHPKLGGA